MIKNKKKKREIDNYTPEARGFVPSTVTNNIRYDFTEVKNRMIEPLEIWGLTQSKTPMRLMRQC